MRLYFHEVTGRRLKMSRLAKSKRSKLSAAIKRRVENQAPASNRCGNISFETVIL